MIVLALSIFILILNLPVKLFFTYKKIFCKKKKKKTLNLFLQKVACMFVIDSTD